jgi:hypothetical protein
MEDTRKASETIKVLEETKGRIIKLAKKHEHYGYEIVDASVRFFEKAGYDPCDMENIEAPAEELKKLRNSIVSFFRKHETEFLTPLVDKLDASIGILVDTVRSLPKLQEPGPPEHKLGQNGANADTVKGSKHKFVLPDSAREPVDVISVVENSERQIELKIQLERKSQELERVKLLVKTVCEKFVKKSIGDGYACNLSRIELEELKEVVLRNVY